MCEIRENAMQKKQFQQNMKDKVRVFEDGGIRLLKRGQKGVVHAIFSRFGLVLVLLLLQAFALFSLLQWFGELLPHYFGGTLLVTAAMMVYLLNQDMDNSVRITWLVVTALMPVLGVPLFWYTKSDVGHNALKRRLLDLEGRTRAQLPQNEQTVELLQEQAPEAVPLARYLRGKGGGFPVYADTVATYFNGGEAMFDEMLRQLETAKKYIFLEYFIIQEGKMWNTILDILRQKAAEGVDVPCEVDVLLTNDSGIHEINREMRQVDASTDVLSFPEFDLRPGELPAPEDADPGTGLVPLGDMVISMEHVAAQAREYGHAKRRELSYLVVHSVLHLLGYDHLDEGPQKARMRAREEAILGELGIGR